VRKPFIFVAIASSAILKDTKFFIKIGPPGNLMLLCEGLSKQVRKHYMFVAIASNGDFKILNFLLKLCHQAI
jgi:hypothetical protein